MAGFNNSNGGRARAPLQDPLAPLQVALGLAPSATPWPDAAKALAAQKAGLPKTGGLIGSTFARYMTDNAPRFLEEAQRRMGFEPPGGGGAGLQPSNPVVAPVPLASAAARPSIAPAPLATAPTGSGGTATKSPPPTVARSNPAAPTRSDDEAEDMAALHAMLVEEEGERKDVYRDKLRVLTTGIGHKVLASDGLKEGDIVSKERRAEFFRKDASAALHAARVQAKAAGITDRDFILRLASVNFQLGTGWTKEHQKTWALIKQGDYAAAAEEAARSDWNKQTPTRVRAFQTSLRALAGEGSD